MRTKIKFVMLAMALLFPVLSNGQSHLGAFFGTGSFQQINENHYFEIPRYPWNTGGLFYQQNIFSYLNEDFIIKVELGANSVYRDVILEDTINARVSEGFNSLPLIVGMVTKSNDVEFYIGGGVSLNVLKKQSYSFEDKANTPPNFISEYGFGDYTKLSTEFELGLSYNLSDRIKAYCSVRTSNDWNLTINSKNIPEYKYLNTSIRFGFSRKLSKG